MPARRKQKARIRHEPVSLITRQKQKSGKKLGIRIETLLDDVTGKPVYRDGEVVLNTLTRSLSARSIFVINKQEKLTDRRKNACT